ncbi:MAG: deoxyribose-phosphate aldolase [Bacilli bacterium]|jgi:deoxyribose-phosphate aldolase|nr:deoxyribose-phosphate aldolase [Bacilli bacterium]
MNMYIDSANLNAYATREDIQKLCEEAKAYHFASVCVNPCYVEYAAELLKDSTVAVDTVIGFPLGANTTMVKSYEAIAAIEAGADEIDMVINIGALKEKDYEYVKNEIEEIRDSIDGHTLKVIIETCYLTEEEIAKMTEICNETFVHFIKTSTGYGTRGATLEDVEIINKYKSDVLEIKASGGIRTYEEASNFLEKGVSRIGTSQAKTIMEGEIQ